RTASDTHGPAICGALRSCAAAATVNQVRERAQFLADLAGIDEQRRAEARPETLAKLDVDGAQRSTAHAGSVRELGSDGLVAVATHRAAAAGVEALIGREVWNTDLDAVHRMNRYGGSRRAREESA